MEITTFIAQIWGPVLIAVGLGFFFSRSYYVRIYRDMEKAPLAVLFFGMFMMVVGIAQLLVHNVWGSTAEVIVSLLGWGLVIKGLVFTAFMGLADKGGDWAVASKLIPFVGPLTLILGAYLCWFGYFA